MMTPRPWTNHNTARPSQWLLRLILLACLLTLPLTPFNPTTTHAQTEAQDNYWSYDASGELANIVVADVNHDGLDDFLVVANENNLSLLNGAGGTLWGPYRADDPILYVTAVNIDGPDNPELEIAVGTRTHLILLTAVGQEIWRTEIELPTFPNPVFDVLGDNEWRRLEISPAVMRPFDANSDGQEDILLALRSGQMRLYDGRTGNQLWEYVGTEPPAFNAHPLLEILPPVGGIGSPEILYTYFTEREFSEASLLDAAGNLRWRHSLSGRITALTTVTFAPGQLPRVALGNNRGFVRLYDLLSGAELWRRTLNVPVTALAAGQIESEAEADWVVAVGTAVGRFVAYSEEGVPLIDQLYADAPNRPIINISPNPINHTPLEADTPTPEPEATLAETELATPITELVEVAPPLTLPLTRWAITLGPAPTARVEPAELLLLDSRGRVLNQYAPASALGLSRLLDINGDGLNELLLATFGSLALRDTGLSTDTRNYVVDWAYRLDVQPRTALTADLNQDGRVELLVGGDDGRLHLLNENGNVLWERDFGGIVTHLGLVERQDNTAVVPSPLLVVVHNNSLMGNNGAETVQGWVELLRPDGTAVWPEPLILDTAVSTLRIADINSGGRPEILIGTNDGQLLAYALTRAQLWATSVEGSLAQLLVLPSQPNRPKIIATTEANRLYIFNNKGGEEARLDYVVDISNVLPLPDRGPYLPRLLVLTIGDGQIRGLNLDGTTLPDWQFLLGSPPVASALLEDTLIVATSQDRLLNLSLRPDNPFAVLWTQENIGRVTDLFGADFNQDTRTDIALGNTQGQIQLLTSDGRHWGEVSLLSGIFKLLQTNQADDPASLVAVTVNGLVQRLRSQPNRPPLLANPRIELNDDLYSISVTVLDMDRDSVLVELYVYNPASDSWLAQGERTATRDVDTLFWTASPLGQDTPLRYRFAYDDGTYQGQVEPTIGPPPLAPEPPRAQVILLGAIALLTVSTVWLISQVPWSGWLTGRFYRQLKTRPSETLILLDAEYKRQAGSQGFLLQLANYARRDRNGVITNLADGLYLLADRPETGLGIIVSVLEELAAKPPATHWRGLEIWLDIFQTALALLQAPTTLELSLLRPRLVQLVASQDRVGHSSTPFGSLLPILASVRDSTRVNQAEDRLVYLHEATVLLQEVLLLFMDRPVTLQNTLVLTILHRWRGLLNAAVDDLRGRAWLVARLKTKRLIPSEEMVIALEVENKGRAAAEQIRVTLVPDPAYEVVAGEAVLPVLAAGRQRTLSVKFRPVDDHASLRVVFMITYNDRHNTKAHQFDFADLVHLLPPQREFVPIINPYAPGTPLRRSSPLFYGREELLNFIINEVGRNDQQSVMILVGQRRTGKTSALLHLEAYAPSHILPVYVDCQSFGVVAGMAAFLSDLAWFMADALLEREIELEVPDTAVWQDNPAQYFQRTFLPQVQAKLPPQTTLLLVFDEFEALENLVNDNYLPKTFFPFLRHLMQHGDKLGFLFAGTHRLEEMGSNYWSVLFNIALYHQIDYLDMAATEALVCQPVAPHIVYDDLALDKIWRVTAGHPYFLQLVCYTLVNRANQRRIGYVTISDVNTTLQEMLRLGEVHFAYLWQESSYEEQVVLTAVAHLLEGEGSFTPLMILHSLEQYNIYLNPPDILTALRSLVERGILQEGVVEGAVWYDLRIGLVGLWVAQNKSFVKLYEGERAQQKQLPLEV